jgi:hypothetical protein
VLLAQLQELSERVQSLTTAIERLIASRITPPVSPPSPAIANLRNVYTVQQFVTEILCGKHSPKWVRRMCRARRIKFVATRPWLIPMSEAIRFINGTEN